MEEWLHVALTWDSGNYVVYVNGENVTAGAYTELSDVNEVANIGNDGSRAPYEGFAGLLDEVRLYDHALNTAEILAAMEGVEQVDITAPDDLVQGVPNDGITYDSGDFGWYDWESPDLVIDDNIETKYLHFKGEIESTGFQVTPSAGASIVTGLTLTTANDFPARDPIAFELYGSNVSINGRYRLIAFGYIIDFDQVEAWPRLAMNATPISFNNDIAYEHYQVLFPAVRDAGRANSMQIAEVELLGVSALSAPGSANIILVTKGLDRDSDGLRDDHSLESFLISEGHNVDVRPDHWDVLSPEKIAELNAADLIIVSRSAWSTYYNNGNEATEWNSL
ncbi:MAG: LamG domain-containing protein, partial [Gammaproteobacteria bacterium]|nr:LamG domain-containing protein [Gammaproteobacteria bacterium]